MIIGHTRGLRCRARLGCTDRSCLRSHVDHDDLVAEAVHFDERMIGEDAHVRLVFRPLYGKRMLARKLEGFAQGLADDLSGVKRPFP